MDPHLPRLDASRPFDPTLFVRTARRLDVRLGEDRRFGVGPTAMNVAMLVRTARLTGGVRAADVNAFLVAIGLLGNAEMADCFGHATASSGPRFRAHFVDVVEDGIAEAFPHPRAVRDALRHMLFACGGSFLGADVSSLEAAHTDLSTRERRTAPSSPAAFALRRARLTFEDALHQVVHARAPFARSVLEDRSTTDPLAVSREVGERRHEFLEWSQRMDLATTG